MSVINRFCSFSFLSAAVASAAENVGWGVGECPLDAPWMRFRKGLSLSIFALRELRLVLCVNSTIKMYPGRLEAEGPVFEPFC